jgi:hypothetical protein
MKGVNVQKIAALAAGIGLLGASVAVADVVYGSTQLVDQNGQPTVKIVVGSKAAASDGVAAANIAAAIANQAYKSGMLTPAVSGTATCTAGSSTGGSGSCTFTDKKVTLEVELPGAAGGAAIFETLINDHIDRNIANRVNAGTDDKYLYANSDTGPDANAFSDQGGNASSTAAGIGVSNNAEAIYKIGSSSFAALKTSTLSDGSNSYTEQQTAWLKGKTYYDTGTNDDFIADLSSGVMAWSAKFTQDDYGIPVCSKITNTNADWTDCQNSELTERKRMKINFLGDTAWIISDMTAPTQGIGATTGMVHGGSITLAKESAYQIVNVGETLEAGAISIRLADISTATGQTNVHPAIIDILDSSGTVVKQIQVDPGTTTTETIGGVDYKFHVYQTAPGFTLNAKWAEIAVYSDELILTDGDQIDNDENEDFYTVLKWKNKGYKSSTNTTVNNADALREIVIFNDRSNVFTSSSYGLKKGDKFSFIADPAVFELQFNGLDLQSSDYDSLHYEILKDGASFRNCTNTSQTITLNGVIRVTSDESAAFTVGSYSGNDLYYDLTNDSATTTFGRVFIKSTGSTSCYDMADSGGPSASVDYYVAGDAKDTTSGGEILITHNSVLNNTGGFSAIVNLTLYEDQGRTNTTAQLAERLTVIANNSLSGYGATVTDFSFVANAATPYVTYVQPLTGISSGGYAKDNSGANKEEGFYANRGTRFSSLDGTSATFEVAKSVGHMMFAITSVGGNLTSTTSETLGVGATTTFGDVKVTVKDITGTGTCAVGPGGVPLCTPDMSGVSATIDGQASLEASVPYKLPADYKMVVLDTPTPSASVLVTVGGPIVNMVTKDALEGSDVNFDTDAVVVKEVGQSRIVVAGATAENTLEAAQNFINGMTRS